ncbi:MAG TPA: hypothetical protein VLJ14_18110 [Ktedonobacterales bacterium]|nr:hypothetical protein [Ktedonobacterales bacterium]
MGAHVDVDDFEIEVTSLWRGREDRDGEAEAWREAASPEMSGPSRSPLAPRLTRRGRMLRAGGACVAVALALLLLISGDPRAVRALASILPTPPPAPPAPPAPFAANVILFEHAVPWGTLRIDHHAGPDLPIPPFVGPTPHYPAFTLSPGRHTIEYTAENFIGLTCTISMPAALADTCPLATPATGTVPPNSFVRLLDLGSTVNRLLPEQRPALLAVVRDALAVRQAPVAVRAGERYLRADGGIATASQPLRAVPVYTLNEDTSVGLAGFAGLCVSLCDADPRVSNATAISGWQVEAHVVVGWRYLDAGGRPALDAAPAATALDDQHAILPLAVRWDDGWQIGIPSLDPGGTSLTCLVASNVAARLANERPDGGNPNGSVPLVAGWAPFVAAAPADGCALTGQLIASADGTARPAPVLLYRFGLLLAANADAHTLYPLLPVADAGERALTQRIVADGRLALTGRTRRH